MRFLAALLTACLPAAAAVVPQVAIQDVTVIDVASAATRPHMTVLIDGEHIRAVGPSVPVPAGARVVSGREKFLIPGLWDMHVHLWYKENQLPVFVAFGVTGVQDMGSDFSRVSAWRSAIESGKAIGPHIVTPGPPVTEQPSGDEKLPTLVARTPEEARKAFDQLWDMDVDFVKVLDGLSRDAYFALAEQARHWHMRLEGHVPRSVTAWEAINVRQRSLEHLFGVTKSVSTDDEALDLFEKCALGGVRISPTLVLWQRMAHTADDRLKSDPRLKYVPESIRKTWPELKDENGDSYKKQIESIYRLVSVATRTKVEILAGTDTGDPYTIPGATLHSELEQLVAAGMTAHQALAAATIAPARFFEREDTMGSIEKGKVADLVLLEANPLEDIRNTRKISAVFSRGKYFSRRDLDTILSGVH
jgi:imidazolonepropionase-like amidohydrolase